MIQAKVERGDTVLEARGITKRFPGVVANDSVNLTVKEGELVALLGENGAGKSTLMNVLYGLYHAEEGDIVINDEVLTFASPADALEAGIGMVHQHFMLADNLTVLENVVLGDEPMRGPRIDFAEAKRRIDLAQLAPSGRATVITLIVVALAVGVYLLARESSLFAVETIDVDTLPARWWARQVFHLLGFRRCLEVEGHVRYSRRVEGFRGARSGAP